MKTRHVGALMLATGLVFAACGSSGSSTNAADGYGLGPSPTTTTPSTVSIRIAHSSLGDILVNGEGRTLYGFTDDVGGTSSCYDACATVWPAIVTNGGAAAVAVDGPSPALLSTAARSDGTSQLKVGKWPAYLFAGDAKPGDVNGEGSGGTWFALRADGSLVKPAPNAAVPAP